MALNESIASESRGKETATDEVETKRRLRLIEEEKETAAPPYDLLKIVAIDAYIRKKTILCYRVNETLPVDLIYI
jgi:hypothetical protein